ncbi:hypothetical protein H6771_02920 [Candidatus Peribacteria bacterium]|nr:hypothetical protein [Candidatus Peribacteria bacterium]
MNKAIILAALALLFCGTTAWAQTKASCPYTAESEVALKKHWSPAEQDSLRKLILENTPPAQLPSNPRVELYSIELDTTSSGQQIIGSITYNITFSVKGKSGKKGVRPCSVMTITEAGGVATVMGIEPYREQVDGKDTSMQDPIVDAAPPPPPPVDSIKLDLEQMLNGRVKLHYEDTWINRDTTLVWQELEAANAYAAANAAYQADSARYYRQVQAYQDSLRRDSLGRATDGRVYWYTLGGALLYQESSSLGEGYGMHLSVFRNDIAFSFSGRYFQHQFHSSQLSVIGQDTTYLIQHTFDEIGMPYDSVYIDEIRDVYQREDLHARAHFIPINLGIEWKPFFGIYRKIFAEKFDETMGLGGMLPLGKRFGIVPEFTVGAEVQALLHLGPSAAKDPFSVYVSGAITTGGGFTLHHRKGWYIGLHARNPVKTWGTEKPVQIRVQTSDEATHTEQYFGQKEFYQRAMLTLGWRIR